MNGPEKIPTGNAQTSVGLPREKRNYCRMRAAQLGLDGGCSAFLRHLVDQDQQEQAAKAAKEAKNV